MKGFIMAFVFVYFEINFFYRVARFNLDGFDLFNYQPFFFHKTISPSRGEKHLQKISGN